MDLGEWLNNVRSGSTQPRWARPILEALGMTDLPTEAQAQAQAQARAAQERAQAQAQARALAQAQAEAQPWAQALELALELALAAPPVLPGPGEGAAAGLLQALSGLEHTGPSPIDRTLARNLRAVVLHYARTGTVNVTQATTETLPGGGQVNLGMWRSDLRYGRTQPRWARPILEALGMTGGPASRFWRQTPRRRGWPASPVRHGRSRCSVGSKW